MKNLNPPFENELEHLNLVVRRKRGPRHQILKNIFRDICRRYDEFNEAVPNLEIIDPYRWNPQQGEALRHCFESPIVTRQKLNASIPERLRSCPYCVIRHANDWDHFMPKAVYPEFIVHPGNLIRVCTPCNNHKSANLIRPERSVIHPYFDDLDSFTFLYCDIVGNPTPVPCYRLEFPVGIPQALSSVIQRHFDEFELQRLYESEGGSQLMEYAKELVFRIDNQLTEQALEREMDAKLNALLAQDNGPNHWRVALWVGARGSRDFMDYVNNQLPA